LKEGGGRKVVNFTMVKGKPEVVNGGNESAGWCKRSLLEVKQLTTRDSFEVLRESFEVFMGVMLYSIRND
jgi:hypothetical protein